MPREIQDVQEQIMMLASVALANDGTASTNRKSKKVGRAATIKYTNTQHLFDFTFKSIYLKDKNEMEFLHFMDADVHIKIDDNLLVVTVVALDEDNLLMDIPYMYMEVC